MRRWLIVLFLLLAQVSLCQPLYEHRGVQYAKHGKDFWFCIPRTRYGFNENHSCLYIMSEHNCRVTISNDLIDFSYSQDITNRQEINGRLDTLNLIEIPWNILCFADELDNTLPLGQQTAALPQPKGFHITSTDTICVFLFAYSMGNMDVTSLIPTEVLRDEYVVQTYPGGNMGMFQVVATEDNTVVDIRLGDYDWLGRPKDSVVTVTLNRGMIYNVMVGDFCEKYPECCHSYCNKVIGVDNRHFDGDTVDTSMRRNYFLFDSLYVDLSGTYIRARDGKRIAVFQGNQFGGVGGGGYDFMFEQALPIRYAGTEFLVPNLMASVYDYIQFTGLVDSTTITIMNPYDPSLPTRTLTVNAHESDWFIMNTVEKALYITSDHPILTSVMPGSNFSTLNRGGSATLVVEPVEWWHSGTANGGQVFWVDGDNNGYVFYHSMHIFTRTADVEGMFFNNYPIDTMFTPIPGTEYSYAYVHYYSHLTTWRRSQHWIENRLGGPFWAVADAEKNGEHAVYSYPHLQPGKNYLEVNGVPAVQLPEDSIWCLYDPIQFHGWVERPADSIIWDFGDGHVERYLYEDGQWVTHTFADTGRYTVRRIIQYMDEAHDTNYGYLACKSVFTLPSDTMSVSIWLHNHYDSSFAVTVCEGPYTFRGHVLETTDTHYVTTYWTPSGCDTLWQIDLVTCPHCSFRADTISDEQLPWVFNGITFGHEVRHYPIYIDIGEECDSMIDYYLIVIPHWNDPPLDTIFVLAPNVIMPEGEIEVNRRFRLFCSDDIEAAEVDIFDRMGRHLAHFDGLTEEWDGTYNGKPLPQGAYAYYVRYIDGSNRNWKTKAGTFSILR